MKSSASPRSKRMSRMHGLTLLEILIVAAISVIAVKLVSDLIIRSDQTRRMAAARVAAASQAQILSQIIRRDFMHHRPQQTGQPLLMRLRNLPDRTNLRIAQNLPFMDAVPSLSSTSLEKARSRKMAFESNDFSSGSTPSVTRIEYEVVCSEPLAQPSIFNAQSWRTLLASNPALACIPENYCDWSRQALVIRKDTWRNWTDAQRNSTAVYPSTPDASECIPSAYRIVSGQPNRCVLNQTEGSLRGAPIGASFCNYVIGATATTRGAGNNLNLSVHYYHASENLTIRVITDDAAALHAARDGVELLPN